MYISIDASEITSEQPFKLQRYRVSLCMHIKCPPEIDDKRLEKYGMLSIPPPCCTFLKPQPTLFPAAPFFHIYIPWYIENNAKQCMVK